MKDQHQYQNPQEVIQSLTTDRDNWRECSVQNEKAVAALGLTNAKLTDELTQLRADCGMAIKRIEEKKAHIYVGSNPIREGTKRGMVDALIIIHESIAGHLGTPLLDELKEMRNFVKFVSTYDDEVGETAKQLLTKWEKKV